MDLILTIFIVVALLIVLTAMAALATLIVKGVYEEIKR